MNAGARIAGFAVTLGVLAGAGAIAGSALEPSAPAGGGAAKAAAPRDQMSTMKSEAGHGAAKDDHRAMAMPVRGLAVAENGLRLVVATPDARRGATEQLRFRIVDEHGGAVRAFDVEHTKRMHLIVARRDLTNFQHLHPAMSPDGTWSTPLRVKDAGSYRIFADFSHGKRATTLATDLRVDGAADLAALPAPRDTARSDGGYDVRLEHGAARAGREAGLRFSVTKDDKPVRVEPYLGAGGHLVALRDGDLAFLHVHPTSHGASSRIGFGATFPTTGGYRLFLQFKVAGTVQTVAFTQEVR